MSVHPPKFARVITDRTVEVFLTRLFLRDDPLQGLHIVSPFIDSLASTRFSLRALRQKVEADRVPTFVLTHEPAEDYQREAMDVLLGSPWIEIRYNEAIHAKLYVAQASRDADSFALFGSANLTSRAIKSNIELAMMVYSHGQGREIVRDLHYWASVRLRTASESKRIQTIRAARS